MLRELGLPDDAEHVNPNGGAIALGHPLGMSGARLALTAVEELHRRGGRYALCTMCIGVGQGIAMIIERVHRPSAPPSGGAAAAGAPRGLRHWGAPPGSNPGLPASLLDHRRRNR